MPSTTMINLAASALPNDPAAGVLGPMAAMVAVLASIALLRRAGAILDRLRRDFGGDLALALEHRAAGAYLAFWHRARFEGLEGLALDAGPLIVAANHTCGLDPVLLQMPLRRRIRWMMWRGQMKPWLGPAWRHFAVLAVEQDGRDVAAVRESLRELRAGGVIGIFPEGGVARPPWVLRPFETGLGVLAARGNAPVLLCLVEGTPAPRIFSSLLVRSRSVVRVIGLFRPASDEPPAAFGARLQATLAAASGWPCATAPAAEAPR